MPTKTILSEPSERIGDYLTRRLGEVGHISQLIIFMDSTGALRAEMPGANGARRKVAISGFFEKRNPELMALLKEDQEQHKAQVHQLSELRSRNIQFARENAEAELARRNNDLLEKAKKRRNWLDSLPASQRALEEKKIDEKLQHAADVSNARARGLYHYIVDNHTLQLAERVIDDPKRRPRRKILISTSSGMKELSPRTGTASINGGKKFDPSLAMEL